MSAEVSEKMKRTKSIFLLLGYFTASDLGHSFSLSEKQCFTLAPQAWRISKRFFRSDLAAEAEQGPVARPCPPPSLRAGQWVWCLWVEFPLRKVLWGPTQLEKYRQKIPNLPTIVGALLSKFRKIASYLFPEDFQKKANDWKHPLVFSRVSLQTGRSSYYLTQICKLEPVPSYSNFECW